MPVLANGRPSLRSWTEIHIRENNVKLEPRIYRDALFRECVITKCSGATLINCCLTDSKFDITNIEEMLGFTMTLDCASFANVELSEQVFDYLTLLLIRSKGNTNKRLKLIDALGGKRRVSDLLNAYYPGNE
jgi:hypothetical protein